MDSNNVLVLLMNQFNTSKELHTWAEAQGVLNDPHVRHRLQELLWQEVRTDLGIHPENHNETNAEQQVIFDFEKILEEIEEPVSRVPTNNATPSVSTENTTVTSSDLVTTEMETNNDDKFDILSSEPESSGDAPVTVTPEEISMLTADALNDEFDPEKSNEPSVESVKKATKSKYFECSRCEQIFRRIQMLREHRKHCKSGDDDEETPPMKKMKQTTLNQYGGQAPSTIPLPTVPLVNQKDSTLPDQPSTSDSPEASSSSSSQYQLVKEKVRTFGRSLARDVLYRVKLNAEDWEGKRLQDMYTQIKSMFADVLKQARGSLTDEDMGRVIIYHHDLENPIVVHLRPLKELDPEAIMEKIEKVLSSNESVAFDNSLKINIGTVEIPKGGRKLKITKLSGANNSLKKKKSIIQIINKDDLCMARALVLCQAKLKKVPAKEWSVLKNPRCLKQKKEAEKLCRRAGVPSNRKANLNDISKFEEALGLQILVLSSRHNNKFIHTGTAEGGCKKVFLYMVEEEGAFHFHAVTSITGFFAQSYFCKTCLKPYNNKKRHVCSMTCIVCDTDKCPTTENPVNCTKCNMICRSVACYERHQRTGQTWDRKKKLPSQCESWWKCPTCKKVVDRKKRKIEDHKCGEWHCECCEKYVLGDHQCFLRVKEPMPVLDKFIMFDFETRQDDISECGHGYVPTSTVPCEKCLKEGHRCNKCAHCKHCTWSSCGKPVHRPNFVVALKTCSQCKDDELKPDSCCYSCGNRCQKCSIIDDVTGTYANPPCNTCGLREKVFSGNNVSTEFGRWLFDMQHRDCTVLAHNMKGFDGYFLLEYLIDNSIQPTKIIYAGSKIMHLQVDRGLNIKVSDSLNFLPMKLAALPKAFGLEELKKGWFPHHFNVKDNQDYVGAYPEPSYYGYDYMSTRERKDFLKWHQGQHGKTFDFKQEMLEYCRSDVMILAQACMKFRELMIDLTKQTGYVICEKTSEVVEYMKAIDPFNYVTIASVCMGIYRWKFLEEEWKVDLCDESGIVFKDIKARVWNGRMEFWLEDEWVSKEDLDERERMTITRKQFVKSPLAQVPVSGYVKKQQYSQISMQWLEWVMHAESLKGNPIHIQHALNDRGEKEIKVNETTTYRLDGYCAATHTVYEFHGCRYHGCMKCFPEDRQEIKDPHTNQSLDELYALTLKKKRYLQDQGMRYIEMWEHDFKQQLATDENLQAFVETLDVTERMDPRDSFFGGRTNACKLHYKVNDGEKVKYVDFTSLYPFINKAKQYPVGHPEIITKDFKDINEYFGIAKVKILPPRGLYHPVLPYRSNGKLKFPLCRTCADNEHQGRCECSDEDRMMVGTWCTPELYMAVCKGYRILSMYEVYHWKETTQYNSQTTQGGLFAPYIDTFLKYKQEASGWPDWCKTEDDKERYVQQYVEREKIQLNPANIQKNPGLRSLAKLCLNSFWGKFGENLSKTKSEFIHDNEAEKFIQMITSADKEVTNFNIVADDIIHVEWKAKKESLNEDFKTNIFLASFTTCWARLELYKVLHQLGERVLYFDTDSIIYISRQGEYDPPLGDYLGDLTSELGCGDVGCKDVHCSGDHWIMELISGGPKNYAYLTNNGHTVCKVRGFTLNHKNSELVNFDTIKDLIINSSNQTITVTNPCKISREKYTRKIYNRQENKDYRMVYTKRVLLENMDTHPYGY